MLFKIGETESEKQLREAAEANLALAVNQGQALRESEDKVAALEAQVVALTAACAAASEWIVSVTDFERWVRRGQPPRSREDVLAQLRAALADGPRSALAGHATVEACVANTTHEEAVRNWLAWERVATARSKSEVKRLLTLQAPRSGLEVD